MSAVGHLGQLEILDGTDSAEVTRVAHMVEVQIGFPYIQLGNEFFPEHLSVALIDAVFTPRLRYEEVVVPIVERYCKFSGIEKTRTNKDQLPPEHDQETLQDLVDHYSKYGVPYMADKVYKSRHCSPGTKILKAKNVRDVAFRLREIGVNVLQDMPHTSSEKIESTLKPIRGIGHATIRMFKMYSGSSDLVKGDVHICRFVAHALNTKKVSPKKAERLVENAASIIGLRPRQLDYVIWKFERDRQGFSHTKNKEPKGSTTCFVGK